MADKKKGNIFKRIKRKFTDVRQELKRVIWPTKEKLVQTSAVVLTIIVIAAVFLTLVSEGGKSILEKVGFYGEIETTATTEETEPVVTEAVADENTTQITGEETTVENTTENTTQVAEDEETTVEITDETTSAE